MTSPAHNRKLKQIVFDLGGNEFQVQVTTWNMNNNTADGEQTHTFGGDDSSFIDEADPDYSLTLTVLADWRSGGISRWLQEQDNNTVSFQLDHHPGVVGEHVRWTGEVKIKAPSVGGDVRTTETQSVTLPCVGKPDFVAVA